MFNNIFFYKKFIGYDLSNFMKLSKIPIKYPKIIALIWVAVFLLSIPAFLNYGHYVDYRNSNVSGSGTESGQAASIMENVSSLNESLTVVITGNPFNNSTIAANALGFQSKLSGLKLLNYSSSASPFSRYADFINKAYGSLTTVIKANYDQINFTSQKLFLFPSSFYILWGETGFSPSTIWNSELKAGFNGSSYEQNFSYYLNTSYNSKISPLSNTLQAVNYSAPLNSYFAQDPYTVPILQNENITNFNEICAMSKSESDYLSQKGYSLTWQIIYSEVNFTDAGDGYVEHFGLVNAPFDLISDLVSPNHKIFLITIEFNVKSGFEYKNGSSPSEVDYKTINSLAKNYFGSAAEVTGNGAISYQTSQLTSSSGAAFGLIFIFLIIAVFITLVSYRAAILSIFFVGIATLLGYTSIFITGLLIGHVDYVVTYTLTAVILGISTDYLVFMIARYRQEIREGKDETMAMELAIERAGKAIIISGITVAATLGMFSLLPQFKSWGLVLMLSIIFTVLLMTTLLSSIMFVFRKNLIMKRGMAPYEKSYRQNSLFYKTSEFSIKHKFFVALVIILLGVPAGYFFLNVPTTYNLETGPPSSLSSVKAFNSINSNFGASQLYPVIVIVPISPYFINGNLNQMGNNDLMHLTGKFLSMDGISEVIGPYSNGTALNASSHDSPYIIDNGKYAYYSIFTRYDPYSSNAINLVQTIRGNNTLIVGGLTSTIIDEKNQNSVVYGELEVLIIAAIFVILFISFRKLRYPIISLSGVFFSVSWSTFILWVISNFILHEALIYLIPIILFIILFSIGNDYTVFLISRIREETKNRSHDEGVKMGMVGSGKVVTSLGLILSISLGSLAFIPISFLKELGFSFVISLLIDTFIIRTFYFPSMLSIFDRFFKLKVDQ